MTSSVWLPGRDAVKKPVAIHDHALRDTTSARSGGRGVPRSGYDIRLLDENQLLRARLKVAVETLEALLPHSLSGTPKDRAQAVVQGEQKLMNRIVQSKRYFPGDL